MPHQRCIFHKLRNLWNAIHPPAALARAEGQQFKKDILQQCLPIFSAPTPADACQLRDDLCSPWPDSQPKFVATLQRDWEQSIAFFHVLARFPLWQRTALPTTRRLERLNRAWRRLFRSAPLYHSSPGLLAAAARILSPKQLI